jgi:hypothetical protein
MSLQDIAAEVDAIADRLDEIIFELGDIRQATPSGQRGPIRALSNRVQAAIRQLDRGLERTQSPPPR